MFPVNKTWKKCNSSLYFFVRRQDPVEGWLVLNTSINWLKCQWEVCKLMTQNSSPLVELSLLVCGASFKFRVCKYRLDHKHHCWYLCSGRRKAGFPRRSAIRCHSRWGCCIYCPKVCKTVVMAPETKECWYILFFSFLLIHLKFHIMIYISYVNNLNFLLSIQALRTAEARGPSDSPCGS